MDKHRNHLRAALISAFGYGLGFVIGVTFIRLVLNIGLLESIADGFENQRLFVGLFILFSVVIFGGGLAGAIGGIILTFGINSDNRKHTVSRSAIGIGAGFGIVLLPILGLITLMAMYNTGDASLISFVIGMGLVGALFGLVTGLMTGTIPARTSYKRIAGVASFSFGLGGLAFGFGLWHYFFTLFENGAAPFELLLAFFVFGGVGGFFLGWIFSLDREKTILSRKDGELLQANALYRLIQWFKHTKFYRKRGFWGTILVAIGAFLLTRLLAMSPLSASSSHISDYLPLDSIGIHWSDPWIISEAPTKMAQPSVAQAGNQIAVVWEQDDDVFLSVGETNDEDFTVWETAINISESPGLESSAPQALIDDQGQIHIVWSETISDDAAASGIFYRTCFQGNCIEPINVSNSVPEACNSNTHITPTIANNGKEILAAWSSNTSNFPFASWQISDTANTVSQGCLLEKEIPAIANPRLGVTPTGEFILVFENGVEVFETKASDVDVGFTIHQRDNGHSPDILIDRQGITNTAWCGDDGQIHYRKGTLSQTVSGPECLNRPTLGQDETGTIHLLWYSNQVEQVSGQLEKANLIFESNLTSATWSQPTIVGRASEMVQPIVVAGNDDFLHLIWLGIDAENYLLNYARYQNYECSEERLNRQGEIALEVAQSGTYRPANDLVPYCYNQYDNLLILPKSDPAYSDSPPTLNGAFDQVADLVKSAKYEVLLSTMWYETDDTNTSPGFVLAQGVKDLYDQVKAHPEQYPRGITVRILLDNPPELTLSNLISQVWNVFQHLRAAGVPTMNNPEIGWKLEVANYAGSWPHGHTKMVVVDGKTAISAGFNYQHKHQSKDHPSGKGKDDFDLGLQMTGPVAQTTRVSFDDLWYGANRINCPDLGSASSLWWLSCRREFATKEHVPEVMKLYLATENSNAFALHRTQKFNESDTTVSKAVASAQETLDVLQVNFTLKLICDLNLIFRVCNFDDALVYMDAMMDAIEAHQVKTRVLIKPGPIEGVESNIAVEEFRRVLEARGLKDLVEFRYFNDSVHAKAVLIDNQFLFVGSQNFHYSAWGEGVGLTEFNIGTDAPEAIEAFRRFFDYHWENGTPVPEN